MSTTVVAVRSAPVLHLGTRTHVGLPRARPAALRSQHGETASVPRAEREPISTVGLLVRFTAAGLIVLISLAALIAFIARQAGTEQATESARQVTYVTARGVVEPRLDAAVIAGRPGGADRPSTRAMRSYVLQGSLVRVKLWNADGKIVYSDEPRLIGQSFPLGAEEAEALRIQGSSDVRGQRPEPAGEPVRDPVQASCSRCTSECAAPTASRCSSRRTSGTRR